MTTGRKIYQEASERIQAKQGAIQKTYEHIRSGTLRDLETPERIRLRLKRLLDHPFFEKIVRDKGITDELTSRSPDQLGPVAQRELERVINGSDFMPVWFLSRGAELRRTVAMIRAQCNGNKAFGTGFLVGPRLLLTNHHVLDWTDKHKEGLAAIVQESFADFDFEEQVDGAFRPTQTFRLQPSTLLLTSPWGELDYVLVALEPRSQNGGQASIEEYGYNRLAGDQGKINTGECVFIIQHPDMQPKTVVVRGNRLLAREDASPYLHYEADTNGGSSGAPVFNQQWEVVGLHHAFTTTSGANPPAGGGAPGNAAMRAPDQTLNEGIRISFILRDLSEKRDAFRARGPAAFSSPECCTAQGAKLLEEALQFQSGMPPKVLTMPLPPRKAPPVRKSTGPNGFSKPD